MLSERQLQALRGRLETEKKRLAAERQRIEDRIGRKNSGEDRSVEDHYDQHLPEVAAHTTSRERDMAAGDNVTRLLSEIDLALEKMKRGEYGVCEHCGEGIAPARLEALPYAANCMTCQVRMELA